MAHRWILTGIASVVVGVGVHASTADCTVTNAALPQPLAYTRSSALSSAAAAANAAILATPGRKCVITTGMSNSNDKDKYLDINTRNTIKNGGVKELLNPDVVWVFGSQDGRTLAYWDDPTDAAWARFFGATGLLAKKGCTPDQVVAWYGWVTEVHQQGDFTAEGSRSSMRHADVSRLFATVKTLFPTVTLGAVSGINTTLYCADPTLPWAQKDALCKIVEPLVRGDAALLSEVVEGATPFPVVFYDMWTRGSDSRALGNHPVTGTPIDLALFCADTTDGVHVTRLPWASGGGYANKQAQSILSRMFIDPAFAFLWR